MTYEVINEELNIEACRAADLTPEQVEMFTHSVGRDSIDTLTLFVTEDNAIVLNKDHKQYEVIKEIVEGYLQLSKSDREAMVIPDSCLWMIMVLEKAIERRARA
ncbi:hypothetical protein [Coprococcus comes]|uniref:Uncharacterized protein n=1 Tax=Coprococcus comes TaxID=410072 RepID=A0A3R6HBL5_9FIRM|nr:hypothetical protein [Coprococcus comes]RHG60181.1 hypothetical protein DW252_08910 [Coprococcus comes]